MSSYLLDTAPAASSTSAMISSIRIRTILCFRPTSVAGEFHTASRSCAKLQSVSLFGIRLALAGSSLTRNRCSTSLTLERAAFQRVSSSPALNGCPDRQLHVVELQGARHTALAPVPMCAMPWLCCSAARAATSNAASMALPSTALRISAALLDAVSISAE